MTAPLQATASDWLAIREYRDFWDVPRMILLDVDGHHLLLDCEFDEDLEDYRDDYRLYLMPELSPTELNGSWAAFDARALCDLGTIAVKSVAFDSTNRSYIDARVLAPFVAAAEVFVQRGPSA
jgi:hypothetical protein